MSTLDLVYIDDYGLLGSNFYWQNREKVKGVSEAELNQAGLVDGRVQIHKGLVAPLQAVDRDFQKRGFRLYIKEGYRPEELYELVYKKRVEMFGQEETDRLMNMVDMPHATGKAVDVAPWDEATNKEIYMRSGDDGADAYFLNFYRGKSDEQSQRFQELQDFVLEVMTRHGFGLGTKNEYFHFNYLK